MFLGYNTSLLSNIGSFNLDKEDSSEKTQLQVSMQKNRQTKETKQLFFINHI